MDKLECLILVDDREAICLNLGEIKTQVTTSIRKNMIGRVK